MACFDLSWIETQRVYIPYNFHIEMEFLNFSVANAEFDDVIPEFLAQYSNARVNPYT